MSRRHWAWIEVAVLGLALCGVAGPVLGQDDIGQGEARINVRSDVKMAIKGTRGTTSANLTQLTDVIADQMTGVRKCYRELIEKRPTTVGSLAIRITLDPQPAKPVLELKQLGVSDEPLIACVRKVIEKAPLAKVARPAAAIVTLDVSNTRAAGESEMQERIAVEDQVDVQDEGGGSFAASWAPANQQVSFTARSQGSREAVEATIRGLRRSFAGLLDCRRRAQKGDLSPAGELKASLRLARSGDVSAKLLSSTVAHERAATCTERALGKLKLESPPAGKQVELTITFAP